MPGTTAFPGALDTFPAIGPNTSEAAPGVEHDVVHENVHAAVAALQVKVGINNSADAASLDKKIAALQPIEFVQSSPASTWVVNHNLGRRPGVEIYTTGGLSMLAAVLHVNLNTVNVIFDEAIAGFALIL